MKPENHNQITPVLTQHVRNFLAEAAIDDRFDNQSFFSFDDPALISEMAFADVDFWEHVWDIADPDEDRFEDNDHYAMLMAIRLPSEDTQGENMTFVLFMKMGDMNFTATQLVNNGGNVQNAIDRASDMLNYLHDERQSRIDAEELLVEQEMTPQFQSSAGMLSEEAMSAVAAIFAEEDEDEDEDDEEEICLCENCRHQRIMSRLIHWRCRPEKTFNAICN